MPLFVVERSFAEEFFLDEARFLEVKQINDEIGIRWRYSFQSADKRKTYCLYESPTAEAIRQAARRLDIPADVVVRVSQLRPDMFLSD